MHQPTDWRPARVRALRTLSPTVREFELEPENVTLSGRGPTSGVASACATGPLPAGPT